VLAPVACQCYMAVLGHVTDVTHQSAFRRNVEATEQAGTQPYISKIPSRTSSSFSRVLLCFQLSSTGYRYPDVRVYLHSMRSARHTSSIQSDALLCRTECALRITETTRQGSERGWIITGSRHKPRKGLCLDCCRPDGLGSRGNDKQRIDVKGVIAAVQAGGVRVRFRAARHALGHQARPLVAKLLLQHPVIVIVPLPAARG